MFVLITAKGGYVNQRREIDAKSGEVIEVADQLAVKLLNNGLAEPARRPARKTTARAPQQNTAKATGKAKPTTRKEDRDAAA